MLNQGALVSTQGGHKDGEVDTSADGRGAVLSSRLTSRCAPPIGSTHWMPSEPKKSVPSCQLSPRAAVPAQTLLAGMHVFESAESAARR